MGGKAGSGQYRLISRPPLGIICNHRPATFVCFIPPPQTTTTQCTWCCSVHLMPPVRLFPFQREWVSPFLPWMALTSLWMRIKRAFHFQSNDVNPSPPLPGMVHKSANLCPTDTVFKIQTNNDKECILQYTDRIYDETCSHHLTSEVISKEYIIYDWRQLSFQRLFVEWLKAPPWAP